MSDLFTQALMGSQEAVVRLATYLSRKGKMVVMMPVFARPNAEQRDGYLDNGDLFLAHRIEVKHNSCVFTCRNDYPYQALIVDKKSKHDSMRPSPVAYYCLNKAMTHGGYVNVSQSKRHWWVDTVADGRPGRCSEYEVYKCPLEHVVFFAL